MRTEAAEEMGRQPAVDARGAEQGGVSACRGVCAPCSAAVLEELRELKMEVRASMRMRAHCCLPSGEAVARAIRSLDSSANLRKGKRLRSEVFRQRQLWHAWMRKAGGKHRDKQCRSRRIGSVKGN